MKGLDTNVLVRYLIQDDPIQSPQATTVIERQFTPQNPAFVSLITIMETVWVLGSVYGIPDSDIVRAVEKLLQADTLTVQNEQQVFTAMIALRTGHGSFADALIGAVGIWAGCDATLTFDKKSLRLGGFELVR